MVLKNKLYLETLSCFSRLRQEKMVKDLEQDFYHIVLNFRNSSSDKTESYSCYSSSCINLSKRINNLVRSYYFEKDLLEYLIQLDGCILKYEKEIGRKMENSMNCMEKRKSISFRS